MFVYLNILITVKFINENVYSHGGSEICNLLSSLLGFLGCASTIILISFFCRVNIFYCVINCPPSPENSIYLFILYLHSMDS